MNDPKPSDLIHRSCGFSTHDEKYPDQDPPAPLSPREKLTISSLKKHTTVTRKCYIKVAIMNHRKTSDQRAKHLAHLHQGAKPSTHQHANELRKRTTEAEQKLWALLRNRQLKGKKFRRQHAIAYYVADFYCHESKLAIELDGNFHTNTEAKEYDNRRTALLNDLGITVLRFWNEEVMNDVSKVLQKIESYL